MLVLFSKYKIGCWLKVIICVIMTSINV